MRLWGSFMGVDGDARDGSRLARLSDGIFYLFGCASYHGINGTPCREIQLSFERFMLKQEDEVRCLGNVVVGKSLQQLSWTGKKELLNPSSASHLIIFPTQASPQSRTRMEPMPKRFRGKREVTVQCPSSFLPQHFLCGDSERFFHAEPINTNRQHAITQQQNDATSCG